MDMVINAGKSTKNVEAFILLPDTKLALGTLIETRGIVGLPPTNPYVFGRLNADTSMEGHIELRNIANANACPGLKHPERISSRKLRTYIGTVFQVQNSCRM